MEHLKTLDDENKVFIHFGTDRLITVKAQNVNHNGSLYKPCGAFWSSTYTPNEEFRSEWECFCSYNCLSEKTFEKYVLFKLEKNARILLINSKRDFRMVAKIFPLESEQDFETLHFLDYNKISEHYDGIYLSKEGQAQTYFELYGWDMESLALFNLDVIRIIDHKGEVYGQE
ncbi:MAG: hypothetical protein RSC42_09175 [Clostridium sp.]